MPVDAGALVDKLDPLQEPGRAEAGVVMRDDDLAEVADFGRAQGEDALGAALQLVGHPLHVGRATEGVDHVGHPGLVGDDLLGSQCFPTGAKVRYP